MWICLSMHHRNLRTLAVELFKVFKGLSRVTFVEVFPVRQQSPYNMRNYSYVTMPGAKTVNHGLESLSYTGSKLWNSIPSHMKEIDSINEFKHVIKTWKPNLCSCRLFKFYLQILISVVSKKKKKERCTLTFPCLGISLNLCNLFEFWFRTIDFN